MSKFWYHLSSTPDLKAIANSSSWREGVIVPRVPDPETKAYQEPEIPRVCLAPKVWQCLAGIPSSEGVYHIYEIETDYPIKAHGTRDAHLISEYWLTDEQLESEIPLKYRGFIELTQDLNTTIVRLSNIKNPKYGILDDPAFWEMPDGGEWKFDEYPQ